MAVNFSYNSYIVLLKEVFGNHFQQSMTRKDFIKACQKIFNSPINHENLKSFSKDNSFLSMYLT